MKVRGEMREDEATLTSDGRCRHKHAEPALSFFLCAEVMENKLAAPKIYPWICGACIFIGEGDKSGNVAHGSLTLNRCSASLFSRSMAGVSFPSSWKSAQNAGGSQT